MGHEKTRRCLTRQTARKKMVLPQATASLSPEYTGTLLPRQAEKEKRLHVSARWVLRAVL